MYQKRALLSTGIAIATPPGCYARVEPRSGLALEYVDVVADVVDPDYRGDVGVVVHNHGNAAFIVNDGDRIAQLIFERAVTLEPVLELELHCFLRGAQGVGSTNR